MILDSSGPGSYCQPFAKCPVLGGPWNMAIWGGLRTSPIPIWVEVRGSVVQTVPGIPYQAIKEVSQSFAFRQPGGMYGGTWLPNWVQQPLWDAYIYGSKYGIFASIYRVSGGQPRKLTYWWPSRDLFWEWWPSFWVITSSHLEEAGTSVFQDANMLDFQHKTCQNALDLVEEFLLNHWTYFEIAEKTKANLWTSFNQIYTSICTSRPLNQTKNYFPVDHPPLAFEMTTQLL